MPEGGIEFDPGTRSGIISGMEKFILSAEEHLAAELKKREAAGISLSPEMKSEVDEWKRKLANVQEKLKSDKTALDSTEFQDSCSDVYHFVGNFIARLNTQDAERKIKKTSEKPE